MTPQEIAKILETSFIETTNLAAFRMQKNILTNSGLLTYANTGFLDSLNSVLNISVTAESKCRIVIGDILANNITERDIVLLNSLFTEGCPIYNNFVSSCKIEALKYPSEFTIAERTNIESMIKFGRDYLEGFLELELLAGKLSPYKNPQSNAVVNITGSFNKDYSGASFCGNNIVDSNNSGTINQNYNQNNGINAEQLAGLLSEVRKSASEEIDDEEQRNIINETTDKIERECKLPEPNGELIKQLTSELEKYTKFIKGAIAFATAVASLVGFISKLF